MIEVVTFVDWRRNNYVREDVVVTVSKAIGWSKGLSPFNLGPCPLWGSHVSANVENAWQFSKAYPEHIGPNGLPNASWLAWSQKGWADQYAHRYPMGKGVKAACSFWWSKRAQNFVRLDYIKARKFIYIPAYSAALFESEAWQLLKKKYEDSMAAGRTLYLVDFDAYPHRKLGMSYSDVVNDGTKTMGHAFVLAMCLEHPKEFKQTVAAYVAERDSGG